MKSSAALAEVNIHPRARAEDESRINQTTISVDNAGFQTVLTWMEAPASREETAGMNRLLNARMPWARG